LEIGASVERAEAMRAFGIFGDEPGAWWRACCDVGNAATAVVRPAAATGRYRCIADIGDGDVFSRA